MNRIYLFADEAGNLDFASPPGKGASRYFLLTTVTLSDYSVGDRLLNLRRELAWEGIDLKGEFHATEESQAVRDRVFGVLTASEFRIDATIVNKQKTYERIQKDPDRFYKLTWYLHLKYVAPRVVASNDELMVVGATFGVRKKQALLHAAMRDVVSQVSPTTEFKTAFWSAASDPCLQVADYCCWALQRKWERGDERSYVLIKDKIKSEFRAFG